MRTRRIVSVLVVFLLMFSWPMGLFGQYAAEETDEDVSEGPPTADLDNKAWSGTGPESRRKEFPNTDTWEWLNPVPAYGKFNDVQWQPGSDVGVIVGHSGLILEREGSVWSIIQSNTIYNLWHIEWRPDGDHALIVGNAGTVIKYYPGEAQHLNPGTNIRLQGAGWKNDGSYALICGWEGTLLKYQGQKFTPIETGVTERLYNVTYDKEMGWLISGENGLLLTYDEPTGNVTRIPSGVDDLLFSHDWYGDMALIVGGNGTILKYEDGQAKKISNSITSNDLYGVEWDQINGYALIGGKDGVALQYKSSGSLSDVSPGTTQWLIGISFLNDGNDALVVGTQGVVYSYVHGAGWTQLSSVPFSSDFKDVAWAPNGSFALIVGSGGTVLKYEDTIGLTQMNSGVSKTLRALSWAPNGSYALIVGDEGTVLRYNGTNFTTLNAGFVDLDLLALDWRSDGQYALIVGSYGKILKWDGYTFTTIIPEDQAKNFLFGVDFHPSNTYSIIAGASGMAYKCEEDPAPKYQPAGVACLRVATGVFSTLRDVQFRDDGQYALLAGLSGIILRYDGSEFEIVEHDISAYSFADIKWKTGSLYPIIVGSEGIFMKYSGYGATQMPCPAIGSLTGASWKGSSALVVGDKDQILLYESPSLNQPFASILKPGEGEVFTIADEIDFSAFASLPPDDASVQFYWLSNITGPLGTTPKFTDKLGLGQHRITLYVNASGGRSDSDYVNIRVILDARPPVPVIVSPVDNTTYNDTDEIYFDASASSDPNGDPLSFYWSSDIEGFLASGTGFTRYLTVIGIHTITLTALDGMFNVSTSINVTIKVANRPPTASIVSPSSYDDIYEGDEIVFEGAALDPDSDSIIYSWFSNVSGFIDDHKMFQGTLVTGRHNITFYADDQHGHNISAFVLITVKVMVHVNVPPILTIDFPDEGQELSGEVNVSGSASDVDGYVVVVEYKIGQDNWRSTDDNSTWAFKIDTLDFENGDLTIQVRAYDGEEHSAITRNVTIANKWKDLHVTVLYPVSGLNLHEEVEVKGRAYHDQDDKGRSITLVEIKVDDGEWRVAHGIDPWVWKFKTEDFDNGEHTLSVRAIDDEGTESEVVILTIEIDNQESVLPISTQMVGMLIALIIIIVVIIAVVASRSSKKGKAVEGRKGKAKRIVDEDEEVDEEE